jgi:hemerythrin-like domain-containing protein
MHATEYLKAEHRLIEGVLDCLEELADQGTRTGTLDWPMAREAVDFLQAFADRAHHAKEEMVLFPTLARKGLSRQYGRSGVMVYEHNQGRGHIRNMKRALADAAAGSPDAFKRFLEHARAYAQLMRRHIRKEDHCLFPWVDRNLTEEDALRCRRRSMPPCGPRIRPASASATAR